MKKIILFAATALMTGAMFAQSLNVHLKNGQTVEYTADQVDYINFNEGSNSNPNNEHEYVDLGIKNEQGHTIYWATCNVGADNPWNYGDYFAWGETIGYSDDDGHYFNWENYKWCNGEWDTMTKYCTHSGWGTVDNKTKLDPEDDAAHVNWGGSWRMPTDEEQTQLRLQCYWQEVTSYRGITKNGYLVFKAKSLSHMGKVNDSTIFSSYSLDDAHLFLPSAGFFYGGTKKANEGTNALYWASTNSGYDGAKCLKFVGPEYASRCNGLTIRPVFEQ